MDQHVHFMIYSRAANHFYLVKVRKKRDLKITFNLSVVLRILRVYRLKETLITLIKKQSKYSDHQSQYYKW
jgi:hypothetical protein